MTAGHDSQQPGSPPPPALRPQRPSLQQIITAARQAARNAAVTVARDLGAPTASRPVFRGSAVARPDVEPLAGMRAARHLEAASHRIASDYIRAAREAGHSWEIIGRELDLEPGTTPGHSNDSIAEAAYTYAVGTDPEVALYYSQSFTWACPSCDNVIRDHGISSGPANDEEGHARHCSRLTAAMKAWDAEWQALEADWEAGQ